MSLDSNALTKREILRSIASNFDIYNFNVPLLNRARLFLNTLQTNKSLDWDTKIDSDHARKWKNICKQLNESPSLKLDRSVGARENSYQLVTFSDSSRLIYGVVIYLYNEDTHKMSFLLAKNRIIGKNLNDKSIPNLEFQALTFGTEVLADTRNELAGDACVAPLNISKCILYTDSLVCLGWVNSHAVKLEKSSKYVFIRVLGTVLSVLLSLDFVMVLTILRTA